MIVFSGHLHDTAQRSGGMSAGKLFRIIPGPISHFAAIKNIRVITGYTPFLAKAIGN
jgi:hypothetical protein